jgi:glycosyltransferase involved in cell wall biosynthesis
VKVGVDATELRLGPPGGVRTACFLLLDALQRHAPEVEVVALAPRPVEVPPGVRVRVTGGPRAPLLWRRSGALRRAARDLDLFHSPVTAFPSLDGMPVTATVHELPFVVSARLEGTRRALVQLRWLSRAMARCAALVAPSRATVRQMRLAHPAVERITHVVPHPAPPTPAEEAKAHDGSLLFVGRLGRRKGVEALLRGAALCEGEVRLVGPRSPGGAERVRTVARHLGILDRVRILGEVDAAMLDFLYRQACAVVLLSASEGFGFPVLEALARSVPVVVARGTGAAEVGGDAVLAVDPAEPVEIGEALRRAADPAYRAEVARKGPARALDFPPERTARGYVEVFRNALGR